MSQQDLTGIEWRFSEWLAANGGLNPDNVLEYFSHSPFWDPNSNNATLKMQTNFNSLEGDGSRLKNMVGVEFELVKEQYPVLYIIQKQRRRSPTEVIPMAVYYVINGNIYQAPDLYSVLANRMLTIVNHLNRAFREVYNFVEFHPSSGYRWKLNLPRTEEAEKKMQDTAIQRAVEFRDSIDRVFVNETFIKSYDKKVSIPAEHPALIKLSSAQDVLTRANSDLQKSSPANAYASTPSPTDGGKIKRKSEKDGIKKKKRVKLDTPQL